MDVVSLGYRTDLALLQLGGTRVEDRGDHLVVTTPDNPGFWWGNYLLLPSMPEDSEIDGWLEVFAREHPDVRHVSIGVDTPEGTLTDLAPFTARGLDTVALVVMTAADVHAPRSRNADAVCRPLTGDADWDQSVRLNILIDPPPGEVLETREAFVRARIGSYRAMVKAGHGAYFGAFLDGRLVAQLGLFDVGDGLARFQQVETDPEFRRQGLAGTLVHHASRWGLGDLGVRTLVMVAEPDYVAIDLYRALGFADTERQLQAHRPPGHTVSS